MDGVSAKAWRAARLFLWYPRPEDACAGWNAISNETLAEKCDESEKDKVCDWTQLLKHHTKHARVDISGNRHRVATIRSNDV
jgi:hypothetical protein